MYHIIINPASRSGKGMRIWNRLVPVLAEYQVSYRAHFTKGSGSASTITAQLFAASPEAISLVILGGDGTFNEVLQGIGDFSRLTVGYIPTGSSNDLARDLQLITDPVPALLHILRGSRIRQIDLGELRWQNTGYPRYFSVSCGIGFDAAVCEEALSSPIKDFFNLCGLGKLTYTGIALKQLIASKSVSCQISIDDAPPIHLPRFLFIASMIHKYEGGGFMFCPQADCADSLLDICIARNISPLKALRILPTAYNGKHTQFPEITITKASSIHIHTSEPLWVHTDGEVIAQPCDQIHITNSKHKLNLLVPN